MQIWNHDNARETKKGCSGAAFEAGRFVEIGYLMLTSS